MSDLNGRSKSFELWISVTHFREKKRENKFFRLSTTITKIISPSHGFENPLTNKGQCCFCLGFFITNQIFSFQTGRRLISVAVATKKTILLLTDCLCWRCDVTERQSNKNKSELQIFCINYPGGCLYLTLSHAAIISVSKSLLMNLCQWCKGLVLHIHGIYINRPHTEEEVGLGFNRDCGARDVAETGCCWLADYLTCFGIFCMAVPKAVWIYVEIIWFW